VKQATELAKSAVIVMGNINLDAHRALDPKYGRCNFLTSWWASTEAAGLEYIATSNTFCSHGRFGINADHHRSCLDHCYTAGVRATAKVLSNASTDHRPGVLTVKPERVLSDAVPITTLFWRNFKSIRSADLEEAIERHRGLNERYRLRDVNDVTTKVVAGITRALDAIPPMEAIRAGPGSNIYLSAETLRLMVERDSVRGISYKHLQNRVSSLVKRDKLRCNLATLGRTPQDSKVLWNLAAEALGKGRPSLPASLKKEDGSNTSGDQEAATTKRVIKYISSNQ
jgi:hypothetical protein